MHITETLIERFIAGRCTPEEAASVSRYLKEHPEVWKRYMIDSWTEAGADQSIGAQEELVQGYRESMLKAIRAKIFRPVSAEGIAMSRMTILRRVSVAAAVIMVIAGAWFYSTRNAGNGVAVSAAGRESNLTNDLPSASAPVQWQLSANRTDQKLKMKLEDGSVVTLLPHSSIRYDKQFAGPDSHKRDIFLQGQAFFDAARDKGRPLTVYAGNMATTVLGTSFSVHENETGVLVKLYSGKVMVHAVEQNRKTWKKDVFLLPGEQLKYETNAGVAAVTRFESKPLPVKPTTNAAADNEEMVFDNTALPEVMTKLTGHYHKPIDYTSAELSNMYFSGSVLKTDSLSVILKVIGNMNGLQITQTTEGFMVHPSKK